LTLSNLATIADFELRAHRLMPAGLFDAMFGAVGEGKGASAHNVEAFNALRLRPRVLRGAASRSTSTDVLGTPISVPVLLAPAGSQRRAHPDGEIAAARAAGAAGTLMVVSMSADYTLEVIAEAAAGPLWFQVYMLKDRGAIRELVHRAEAASYRAIVLTVDLVGSRTTERRPLYLSGYDDPDAYPNFAWLEPARRPTPANFPEVVEQNMGWSDVDWLLSITSLPVVLKGIQTGEDANLACEHGVNAVIVSNHGGHALPSARATIDALPEVVDAIGGRVEVLMDGGVRSGGDVLKAVALGARAVLIGRSLYWGLAAGGAAGLTRLLEIFAGELDSALGLCGLRSLTEADRTLLESRPFRK
jgi:4-hydroxymandelate oxidase